METKTRGTKGICIHARGPPLNHKQFHETMAFEQTTRDFSHRKQKVAATRDATSFQRNNVLTLNQTKCLAIQEVEMGFSYNAQPGPTLGMS